MQMKQTIQEVVSQLKAQKDLTLSQANVEKFLVTLGYAESGAGSIISMGVKSKKFRRYRHPEMGTYIYLRGAVVPDGAVDHGYQMLKARSSTPKKSKTQKMASGVQLAINYGQNKTLLLGMDEGREIFDQLGQVFG